MIDFILASTTGVILYNLFPKLYETPVKFLFVLVVLTMLVMYISDLIKRRFTDETRRRNRKGQNQAGR